MSREGNELINLLVQFPLLMTSFWYDNRNHIIVLNTSLRMLVFMIGLTDTVTLFSYRFWICREIWRIHHFSFWGTTVKNFSLWDNYLKEISSIGTKVPCSYSSPIEYDQCTFYFESYGIFQSWLKPSVSFQRFSLFNQHLLLSSLWQKSPYYYFSFNI